MSLSGNNQTEAAADTLAALASEHRIKILRAFAEVDELLTLSNLRELVGM